MFITFLSFLAVVIVIFVLAILKLNLERIRKQNIKICINPIQDGPFQAAHVGKEGDEKALPHVPKLCHTYATIMNLGKKVPFLKKIRNVYESRGIRLQFC